MIFIYFQWFVVFDLFSCVSLIFDEFHWFSLIYIDFHLLFNDFNWFTFPCRPLFHHSGRSSATWQVGAKWFAFRLSVQLAEVRSIRRSRPFSRETEERRPFFVWVGALLPLWIREALTGGWASDDPAVQYGRWQLPRARPVPLQVTCWSQGLGLGLDLYLDLGHS